MSKKATEQWKTDFDAATADHDGVFGHNCEKDKSDFKRLIKLGAEIEFLDYYSVKIKMPKKQSKREEILLQVMEMYPSHTKMSKTTNTLSAEWHY
jgi:hypothetical protein